VESGGLEVECDQPADLLGAIPLGPVESPLLVIQRPGFLAGLGALLPGEDVDRGEQPAVLPPP
jgi:hypothetical protein